MGRSDTLEGARGSIPFLSVLGGPAAIRRSPVVHALAPRVLEPGRALEVLGAGVDRVRTFALLDARQTSWSLAPIGNPTEARARVRLPAAMPAGSASVLIDDAKIAHGAVAVGGGIQGGDPPRGGVWDPADGDCLVVAADPLYDALESLTQDLLDRGFRPSRARLSSLLEAHAPASPEEAIRLAVADACAGFAAHPLALILVGTASEDLPERDLIPTAHVAYDHELPGYYDGTYADDGLFGDLPGSADLEPELLVGRIPARTPQELSQYVAKLLAYRSQAPRASVLLAVGDANINRDNGDRGRAAASLLETATRAGFLDGEIQRASAYMPLSEPANRQRALGDFLGFLSSGIGLLDLFGNNTGPADLVHMLEAPPGPSHPQITAGMMPTEGKLPIALLHTCLNGAFDEDMHFQGGDSPVEEWVRHPTRGVIAAIAQSHITTFFDDWELGERILERLERADGASLGALHAGARSLLLRQPRTARSAHSIRMANLLGDPLLSPALGIDQIRLDGSFDVAGSWPRQGCLSFERDWTTADLDLERAHARVAYGGVHLPLEGMGPEEPVYPIGGSRMLRVGGFHGLGRGRRAAAWTVFRCDLLVRRGSVLSYWARQEHDPQGRGRLAVDAVTETGRVLSVDLRD
ncbi:MAG: hypothetical protein FJY88_13795, partial [Candidatus Eisenbacteria bacterium]|nr:hypothetical protein [Candidatus Eisenbacteria bacterium]